MPAPHLPLALTTVDSAFDEFARREPLFAVITDPANLSDRLDAEGRERFFAAGQAIVEAILKTVELRLDSRFAPSAVLEFGCGPGRLAIPLARRSARKGGSVVATDRSPAMLAHARQRAEAAGVRNIEFVRPVEVLENPTSRFDLVTCYLVLQRLAPADGLHLIRALLDTLLPGGIGVFQFPISSRVSGATRAVRRAREALPVLDRAVQALRPDSANGPFIPTHLYSLTDVVEVFRERRIASTHVVFDDHGDLSSVIAYVTGAEAGRVEGSDPALQIEPASTTSPDVINVRDVIAANSLETLNEAAEQYFASLTSWDHHLAKPLASADEAPSLLSDVAIGLRALRLRPGLRVLDFGAGTGWLARMLTQLGCSVVVLDVSPTALEMARSLYTRLPVVGEQPQPLFLHFDGRRIDLPDGSLDRIVCFHAFHHAANPDDVIAEFGRVLGPGGIAAFVEPGARHSRSAKSQFEMRNYRVVENDVDVHHLWDVARRHRFTGIRVFAANNDPLELSLDDYTDLCRGGPALDRWARDARRYAQNVSNFVLLKPGVDHDSASAEGLAAVIHVNVPQLHAKAGEKTTAASRVTNAGSTRWRPAGGGVGAVSIGIRLYDTAGALVLSQVTSDSLTQPARMIEPGETVDALVVIPGMPAGEYRVELDCVASEVTWFAQAGSTPATLTLVVSS